MSIFDFKMLNGKSVEEAKEILLRVDPKNTNIRVVGADSGMTMDYVATRINLRVENHAVVDAWVG